MSQSYCKGKIRLLHKLTGIQFWNRKYEDVHTRCNRNKGYHVFPNESAVENRFNYGKPMSFIYLNFSCNEGHVAFTRGESE
jgi:hypothetical protein